MGTIQVGPISGFPEWLPEGRLAEQRAIARIQASYELYGFTPLQTPAVERLDVLTAKGGMKRQIFTLGKPEEGDHEAELGLRFDLTVPLARYVVQHAAELTFPFRRYQIDKVWRGERAQRGRFREFYQCDIDIIGRNTLDPIHDAEVACVINSTFEALKIPEFQIHLSNRRILGDLLSSLQCEPRQLVSVLRAIDKSHRQGEEQTRRALAGEGVRPEQMTPILELIGCHSVADARMVLTTAKSSLAGLEELEQLLKHAESLGMPAGRLRPDFTIARGLDYYTSTVYETFIAGKETWGSICSGGRYEDLAGFFSTQKYPGVGVSIGLSRLLDLLVGSDSVTLDAQSPTQVLVTMLDRQKHMADYLGIGHSLRGAGIATEVYLEPKPLRDQIGYASTKGIPFAVIAGGNELEHHNVLVKDLRRRSQEVVTLAAMAQYIETKLRETHAQL
jgi:histidyl-tRNA synthetase